MSKSTNNVALTRCLNDDSKYYSFPQHLITCPSNDENHFEVMLNTPAKTTTDTQTKSRFPPSIDSVKYDKTAFKSIGKMSEINEIINLVESCENIDLSERKTFSYQKITCLIKDYVQNIKSLEDENHSVFYSCVAEQIEIREKTKSKTLCPDDSCTLAMAHGLLSHTKYENIIKNLPYVLLSDHKSFFHCQNTLSSHWTFSLTRAKILAILTFFAK